MSKFRPNPRLTNRVSVSLGNRIIIGAVAGIAMLTVVIVLIVAQMGDNKSSYANVITTCTKTYSDLNFKKVIQTSDGKFVMSDGVHFIKTDSSGNIIWSKTIDPHYPVLIQSLVEASDKSIIGLSQTTAGTAFSKIYIIRLEASGTLAWSKLLTKAASEFAYGMAADGAGNVYLCGSGCTASNYILKIDANGTQQWFKDFAVTGANTGAQRIFINADNTITVVGKYEVKKAYSIYISQFNINGQWISGKKYTVAHEPLIKAVTKCADGGYVVAGNYANAPNTHPFIMKTDEASNLQWFKSVNTDKTASINEILITDDNYIMLAGNVFVNENENVDAMILKVDMTGNLVWKVAAGSPNLNGAGYDDALSLCKADASNFIVTGFSGGGFITMLDGTGSGFCHNVDFNMELTGQSVEVTPVVMSPVDNQPYMSEDVAVSLENLPMQSPDVCFGTQVGHTTTGIDEPKTTTDAKVDDELISVYPNPNVGIYTVQFEQPRQSDVTVEVYDLGGKQLKRDLIKPGVQQYQVDQSTFSSGTYFIMLKEADRVFYQAKIMVQKQ